MESYKLLLQVSKSWKANCEIIIVLLNAAGNNFYSDIVDMQTPSQLKHIFMEIKNQTQNFVVII